MQVGKHAQNVDQKEGEKLIKMANKTLKRKIKFLKHAVKYNGKRARVWYSQGELYHYPKGTITISAKDYGKQLPPELNPKNETEYQTDYFDTDRARITPTNKYYKDVQKIIKQLGKL